MMRKCNCSAGVVEMKSIAERVLDLKRISFNQESRLMTNKRCELPTSLESSKKGYEEVHVPPKKTPPMSQTAASREHLRASGNLGT